MVNGKTDFPEIPKYPGAACLYYEFWTSINRNAYLLVWTILASQFTDFGSIIYLRKPKI